MASPAPRRARGRQAGWAASGATLAAVGIGAGVLAATRGWERQDEPTGGDPLAVPDGRRTTAATTDGATISITVIEPQGGARPDDLRTVVLSHCWTGDHRVWGPVARRLVDGGHRVVLYDQRGHGASTVGSDGCTLAALGADLRTVIEHLDLRGIVLAGHSMGGMASQAYAIEHADSFRDRVDGLVLVATASSALGSGRTPTASLIRRVVGTGMAGKALARPRLGAVMVRNTVGAAPSLVHLGAVCETFVSTTPRARLDFFRAMEAMDYGGGLPDVSVPAIVACGTNDWLTPLRHSERLADAIPGARLEVLPGAGHMLPFEAPDHIVGFIAELAAV
jgi:non-heme chloroperoxidase